MPRRIGFSTFSETFAGGDYTADEWEFIRAVAAYQKRWDRRYPSWREVLHILLCLGYRKIAPPTDVTAPPPTAAERELARAARPGEAPADS
jgi:hypothetical protein